MKYFFKSLFFLFPLVSCDMVEVHPYDTSVSEGRRNVNAENCRQIEQACRGKETIRFAFVSDTQRWYDETEDMVKNINARGDIDFVIHGGDISDFGATKEFVWQQKILDKLRMPYVVNIGNHDFLGSGDDVFRALFGEYNFSFTAGNVRFLCLNTSALEVDYSNPVPDFGFMESEIAFAAERPEIQKTVVTMHCAPYSEQFNNNVAKVFEHYVMSLKNPLFCVYGHDHRSKISDIFGDGMIYYGASCAKYRGYFVFTITDAGYTYEEILF